MAKKKSKILKQKKRAKRRYRAGGKIERLDMRKGGRVQLQTGGDPRDVDMLDNEPQPNVDKAQDEGRYQTVYDDIGDVVYTNDPEQAKKLREGNIEDGPTGGGVSIGRDESQDDRVNIPTPPTNTNIPGTDGYTPPEESKPALDPQSRDARITRTAETIEGRSAQGIVPEAAVIEDINRGRGTKVDESIQAETKQLTDEDLARAQAGEATSRDVTATTGTAATTGAPTQVSAAQMDAAQTDSAVAQEAQGIVSDKAELTEDEIAKAADVADVAPIEGADVDIPEGALTDRVVGTLSEDSKAVAAQNAGTSLRRITRAKKQLSKAGLTDEQIAEIGNDPEALEDMLADFSEEERGIIEGLPEEALVSTQIEGLLNGIEEGQVPVWARPAVASVEMMLAKRGMSASTVGRDSLLNAIIQSAMPIAQSNAQAIQSSVAQQKDMEFREAEANTQRRQQTALTNANNVFQMNMAQFSSDQQIALSNSRFLQTVGLTEASNEQQATIQRAVLLSQTNLAEADAITRLTAQNSQAFLQMDMSNLSNEQQAKMFTAQSDQQAMLSNQAATNASRQFNATSENQTNQFMANLSTQVSLNNTQQLNAMEQFNTQQTNLQAAQDANRAADVAKLNAQLETQIDQYNAQQEFTKNQWNIQNAQAIEQANTQWRRQANTINTASQNAINQQNAQNAFALSNQAQTFLWQELRDQADYNFKSSEGELQRKASLAIAALGNDGLVYKGRNVSSALNSALGAINNFAFGSNASTIDIGDPGRA